jgi:hypothetical protein
MSIEQPGLATVGDVGDLCQDHILQVWVHHCLVVLRLIDGDAVNDAVEHPGGACNHGGANGFAVVATQLNEHAVGSNELGVEQRCAVGHDDDVCLCEQACLVYRAGQRLPVAECQGYSSASSKSNKVRLGQRLTTWLPETCASRDATVSRATDVLTTHRCKAQSEVQGTLQTPQHALHLSLGSHMHRRCEIHDVGEEELEDLRDERFLPAHCAQPNSLSCHSVLSHPQPTLGANGVSRAGCTSNLVCVTHIVQHMTCVRRTPVNHLDVDAGIPRRDPCHVQCSGTVDGSTQRTADPLVVGPHHAPSLATAQGLGWKL